MKVFQELVEVIDELMGPEGCPWDREQTLATLRSTLLEEACELIEAIDLADAPHIEEELGDLFLNAVMIGKVAEKEGLFSLQDALKSINEKLVRRHPHVFGEVKVTNSDEVKVLWASIKEQEKGKESRKSLLDGIPVGLPALARARKMIKKMRKAGAEVVDVEGKGSEEELLGLRLFALAEEADRAGIDPENALRKVLAQRESHFRQWELGTVQK